MIHLNIRSLNCNINNLNVLLHRVSIQFDIIILTECWLKKISNYPHIPGYSLYNSTFTNQNDGVVILIKSDITQYIIVSEPTLSDANCLLVTMGKDLNLLAIYRSPSVTKVDNFLIHLNDILLKLPNSKTSAIIGDLNVNIAPESSDRNCDDYLNVIASHGFTVSHTFPTRVNSCLDHVLVKGANSTTTLVFDSPFTDHIPVALIIHNESPKIYPKFVPKLDYNSIIKDLDNTDFSEVTLQSDPNKAAQILVSKITSIMKLHTQSIKVPYRQITFKPWITPGLLKCIRHRDKLFKRYKKYSTDVNKLIYFRYRNFSNNLLKKVKREFHQKELSDARGNLKETWKTLKGIAFMPVRSPPSVDLLHCSTDPKSSVNMINRFFVNVGKELATKIRNRPCTFTTSPALSSNTSSQSMALLPTDEKEILSIINKLRKNCAVGFDGISTKILQASALKLSKPLCHLFNLCISSGRFPLIFKKALIYPIYKSGDKTSVNNYRPISILTTLSKIFEKILNSRLVGYLETNNLISRNQYGFRRGLGTDDAVLEVTNTIIENIDNKSKIVGVFLDLSKAFDTVFIPTLIRKMENIGIRGLTLDLFADYLDQRSQCVRLGSHCSTEEFLSYGVPQGSVLGPTLFLIYINELSSLSMPHCKLVSYADDTVLLIHGKDWDSVHAYAEQSLAIVSKWLNDNLLTLNLAKTKYIAFSPTASGQPPLNFSITPHICSPDDIPLCKCTPIERVHTIIYLGVHIDLHLYWNKHIDYLISKIRKLFPIFIRLRGVVGKSTLKLVYYALAQSVFGYCITSWGGIFKMHMLRLERAQRALLRVILKKPYKYPTIDLYEEFEVLSVRKLYLLNLLLRTHKSTPFTNTPTNKRRNYMVCKCPTHKTTLACHHYKILSPRLYNNVNKLTSIYRMTMALAKRTLIQWLSSQTYDSIEDLFNVIV